MNDEKIYIKDIYLAIYIYVYISIYIYNAIDLFKNIVANIERYIREWDKSMHECREGERLSQLRAEITCTVEMHKAPPLIRIIQYI